MENDFEENNKSRLEEALQGAKDWLHEQAWYLELKAKWEEIPGENRFFFKVGVITSFLLAFSFYMVSAMWTTSTIKAHYRETANLIQLIDGSEKELANFKKQLGGANELTDGAQAVVERAAMTAEIKKEDYSISNEKPGKTEGIVKESLIDIQMKQGLTKHLARLAFELENGGVPAKIRYMKVESRPSENFLTAKLSVSTFGLKKPEAAHGK